jgi:hypothetical protein
MIVVIVELVATVLSFSSKWVAACKMTEKLQIYTPQNFNVILYFPLKNESTATGRNLYALYPTELDQPNSAG